MARKKINEEQCNPKLLKARWFVKNLIAERIKIGKEFLNSRIPSMAILEDVKEKSITIGVSTIYNFSLQYFPIIPYLKSIHIGAALCSLVDR
jgi:hypothetical protein